MKYLLCAFALTVAFTSCQISHSPIPQFTFYDLNGNAKTNADLVTGKPTVLVFFHPKCEHCQTEADSMVQRATAVEGAQVAFVSADTVAHIAAFDSTYRLSAHGFEVWHDAQRIGKPKFEVKDAPTVVVYSAARELVVRFRGAPTMRQLLEKLKEAE